MPFLLNWNRRPGSSHDISLIFVQAWTMHGQSFSGNPRVFLPGLKILLIHFLESSVFTFPSAENALGRLLAEVISKSGDTLILDWVGRSSTFHSRFPATIVPYQTGVPSQLQLSDLTAPPNVGWIWSFFTLRYVRNMHQALSRLPLTQFINFRLILPCIVYRIKTIALTRVDTSTAAHVHCIEVTGLEPIEIASPCLQGHCRAKWVVNFW